MSDPVKAEIVPIERDLWWGYLCPALANIGALKDAQRDLVALGADWAEAGRILSRVQSFYVDAAHRAARRYLDESGASEVRVLWAVRWPDGTLMGPMYSDDGSDYAEQVIRSTADGVGGETVIRTETITRTPWEPAPVYRPVVRVHNHPPYRPACNERDVDGQLRGACLNDDGSDRDA